MQVYLAGPEVFLPEARAIGAAKQAICRHHGLVGHFPLDADLDLTSLPPREAAFAIFRANLALMQRSDAVIANLTPFRGPSADVGTAFEVGFMAALGKPLFAYSNATGDYAHRVRISIRTDDLLIEDFGLVDNLMLDGAIAESGGLFLVGDTPAAELYSDLTLFSACAAAAAERLAG